MRGVECPKCKSSKVYGDWLDIHERLRSSHLAAWLQLIGKALYLLRYMRRGHQCVCMDCGHIWYDEEQKLTDRITQILSKHLGEDCSITLWAQDDGYLQVDKDSVTIFHPGKDMLTVALGDIMAVQHREAMGPLPGRLSIRDRTNRYAEFPKTYDAAQEDPYTVLYDSGYAKSFLPLSSALKEIAEVNKNAGIF